MIPIMAIMSLPEDHFENIRSLRNQRHADGEFTRPLLDQICEQSVNSDWKP